MYIAGVTESLYSRNPVEIILILNHSSKGDNGELVLMS